MPSVRFEIFYFGFLKFTLNLISEFPMRQVCRPNLMFGENYGVVLYKIGLTAANTENLLGRLMLWRVQITFFSMGPSSDSDYSPDPLSQKSTVKFSSQFDPTCACMPHGDSRSYLIHTWGRWANFQKDTG